MTSEKRTTIKNVLSATVFIVLLFVSIFKVCGLLEHKASVEKYKQFHEEDTTYDVIFFGTSHTYNSILCQELWDKYNITSYNWGYDLCTIPEDYYLIQEVCNIHKPKVVVLDLYGLTEYEGKVTGGDKELHHVQYNTLPLTKLKVDSVKDIFEKAEAPEQYLFSIVKFHNRWEELSERDFNPQSDNLKGSGPLYEYAPLEGYEPLFDVKYFVDQGISVDLDTVGMEYLIKIIDYCENNNIKLLLTYLPYPADSGKQIESYEVAELLKSYPGVKYLNLIDTPALTRILDMNTDIYRDGHHLSYTGAYKTTMEIGEYLINTYEVGMPDEETVKLWNEDYKKYIKDRKAEETQEE